MLKVVTTFKDSEVVLDGIIWELTVTLANFRSSTTRYFKLIPFQDNSIGRERLTELITRKNGFIHSMMASSVVDGGWYDGVFNPAGFYLEVIEGVE